jgi:hypothetical protein
MKLGYAIIPVLAFLTFIPSALSISITNNDFYITKKYDITLFKNGTVIDESTYIFTYNGDLNKILNQTGHVYLNAQASIIRDFSSTCSYIDSDGNSVFIPEINYTKLYVHVINGIKFQVIPYGSKRFSTVCSSLNRENFGNYTGLMGETNFQVDESQVNIVIEKHKNLFNLLNEYNYLSFDDSRGDLHFSLDNSNENYYILKSSFAKPILSANTKISFEQKFDWNLFKSQHFFEWIVGGIIVIILEQIFEHVTDKKLIRNKISKLFKRKSTSPSEQHPSKS